MTTYPRSVLLPVAVATTKPLHWHCEEFGGATITSRGNHWEVRPAPGYTATRVTLCYYTDLGMFESLPSAVAAIMDEHAEQYEEASPVEREYADIKQLALH